MTKTEPRVQAALNKRLARSAALYFVKRLNLIEDPAFGLVDCEEDPGNFDEKAPENKFTFVFMPDYTPDLVRVYILLRTFGKDVWSEGVASYILPNGAFVKAEFNIQWPSDAHFGPQLVFRVPVCSHTAWYIDGEGSYENPMILRIGESVLLPVGLRKILFAAGYRSASKGGSSVYFCFPPTYGVDIRRRLYVIGAVTYDAACSASDTVSFAKFWQLHTVREVIGDLEADGFQIYRKV